MDNNTKDQLITYIKGQLQIGVKESIILNAVKANGWTDKDYADLSAIAKAQLSATTNIIKPPETLLKTMPIGTDQPMKVAEIVNKKSKSSFGKIFFIIIILLLIISGGAYLYLNKKAPVTSVGQNNNVATSTAEQIIATSTATTTMNVNTSTSNIKSIGTTASTSIINCGNNLDCFISAANICEPSTINFLEKNSPVDNGSANVLSEYNILRKQNNNCVLSLKLLNFEVTFDSTTTNAMLNSGKTLADITNLQKQADQQMLGTTGVCTIGLTKNIGNALNGAFFTGASSEDLNKSCSSYVSSSSMSTDCTYPSGMTCTILSSSPY